ncbi:hypothetical protein [Streptomyces decoyicus]|uniref:hypothetical protein n=1 Tax=Streptomyces decoyicus TaxID=249567 RepID=UPI003800059A
MPHSDLRNTVAERASYTRESATAAAHGVTRDLAFGLDACTPRQQQLRALLALAIFNCGRQSAWPRHTPLHELSIYTFTISPRRDELVIITEAPHNIVGRLVPRDHLPEWGLPGLRVKREGGNGAELVHLPTRARMTVTRDRAGRLDHDATPQTGLWHDDRPLTKEECTVLESLPAMSAQAPTLLGALTTRMSTKDPSGSWDIAMWFTDPLDRPVGRSDGHTRRLWGKGNRWELAWTSYAHPEDLLAALTAPRVGVPGATAQRVRTGWDIRFRDALLALRP